jgi:hypothetical protein
MRSEYGAISNHLWLGGIDYDFIRESYASKGIDDKEADKLIQWSPLTPDADMWQTPVSSVRIVKNIYVIKHEFLKQKEQIEFNTGDIFNFIYKDHFDYILKSV